MDPALGEKKEMISGDSPNKDRFVALCYGLSAKDKADSFSIALKEMNTLAAVDRRRRMEQQQHPRIPRTRDEEKADVNVASLFK